MSAAAWTDVMVAQGNEGREDGGGGDGSCGKRGKRNDDLLWERLAQDGLEDGGLGVEAGIIR